MKQWEMLWGFGLGQSSEWWDKCWAAESETWRVLVLVIERKPAKRSRLLAAATPLWDLVMHQQWDTPTGHW